MSGEINMFPLSLNKKEIKPGCRIAYSVSLGQSACLRLATVVDIQYKPANQYNDTSRLVHKVVIKADDLSKNSTLNFPNRIVVLEDAEK